MHSTLSRNESYTSASSVTSPMSLLTLSKSLPTPLLAQHKLQPLPIPSMIGCSLWSLMFPLETCNWFQEISVLMLVQISSHGGLSLVHMAWVTAMAMVRDCLPSAQTASFSSSTLGLNISPSAKSPGSVMAIVQGNRSHHRLHSCEQTFLIIRP